MGQPNQTYIIAEAGVNHNGSVEMAVELIDAAARSGADAVKFQTFRAERIISKHAPKADYQKQTTRIDESQLAMVQQLELSEADHHILMRHCLTKDIQFISTPFDLESVDFLTATLKLQQLKISSGDITNAPLLLKAAHSATKIILSTGMSSLGDIEVALGVIAFGYTCSKQAPTYKAFVEAYCSPAGQQVLLQHVTLLHCTTEYPTPFEDVNLRAMKTLADCFGLPVGLSDHTQGIAVPMAATALGAKVIEKHFTLDRNLPGPDHLASLEPSELAAMVKGIRQVERALGTGHKVPSQVEVKNIIPARKSIVAKRNIQQGELLTEENITVKRPGSGISPMLFWEWVGKVAQQDYHEDEVIGV